MTTIRTFDINWTSGDIPTPEQFADIRKLIDSGILTENAPSEHRWHFAIADGTILPEWLENFIAGPQQAALS